MTLLSRTLLTLAALGTATGAQALTVEDADVKLGLSLQLQVRADYSDAQTGTGANYSIHEGNVGGTDDPVDFYVRRMRIGFKGSYKDDYRFAALIRLDGQDREAAASGSRTALAHVAYLERVWKSEDGKLEQSFRAGLDYAFFNGSSAVFPSGSALLPAGRVTENMLAPRGAGVGYKLDCPMATWGVDVQNNINDDDDSPAPPATNPGEGDGLFYSTRIHLTPPGDLAIKKPVESFAGKEGKGVMLSAEYGVNVRADTDVTTDNFGFELLGHVDALTALAEFRAGTITDNGAKTETKQQIWLVQAGYAFPLLGKVVEPAARYSVIDLDTDNDNEGNNYGTNTDFAAASGTQIEVGVNCYLNGYNNKVQVMYQMWEAEEGDADAQIVCAQWGMYF